MTNGLAIGVPFAILLTACSNGTGDNSGPADPGETVITVEIAGASIGSVEFEASSCPNPPPGGTVGQGPCPVAGEGVLEPLGEGANPGRPTTLWRAPIDLPSDRYFIDVRVVNESGVVVCDGGRSLDVGTDAPTDGYFFLDCGLDERMAYGRAILTAETLQTEELVGVQAVTFLLDCRGNGDTFLDNDLPGPVTINGNLEVTDSGSVDLGGGPLATEIWQETFEDLPSGPCFAELNAVDGEGSLLCGVGMTFILGVSTTASTFALLPCSDASH